MRHAEERTTKNIYTHLDYERAEASLMKIFIKQKNLVEATKPVKSMVLKIYEGICKL